MIHIDGDALVYLAGFAADSRNGPFSHSAHNIKLMINKVLNETDQHEFRVYLTSTDPSVNFRTELLPSYKGNRKKTCKECGSDDLTKESWVDRVAVKDGIMKRRYYACQKCNGKVFDTKPVYYNRIRKFLVEYYGAKICEWGEADDWLGVRNPDWIATHDKDLYQIGNMNFYNLKSGDITEVEDELGLIYLTEKRQLKGFGFKWFCAQMLTGDKVDNIIKPYKGDGPVWIEKVFGPLKTMRECWNMVDLYYRNTGNEDSLWLMAQLLWVARRKHQRCNEAVIEQLIEENE